MPGAECKNRPRRWHGNLNGQGVDASFQPAWQARGPRVSRRCAGDFEVGPTGKSGPVGSNRPIWLILIV